MRVKTTVGLAIAGAAAAVAVGGVAYAASEPEPRPVVRIVTDETDGHFTAYGRDCPNKSGSDQPGEPGTGSDQPSEGAL
jgi:hypothetical protein